MATKNEIQNAPKVEPNAAYWHGEYSRVNGEIYSAEANRDRARKSADKSSITYWNRRARELRAVRNYVAGKSHKAEIAEAIAAGEPIHIKSEKRNAFETLCGRSTIDPDAGVISMMRPHVTLDNAGDFCAECVGLRR